MRIAVTYENGEIFQYFGHTEQFKIYDVENKTEEMKMGEKFFVCEHCGNLVGIIHDAGVPMMCCGLLWYPTP